MDNLPEDGWRLAFAETALCAHCERRYHISELEPDENGDDTCAECAADIATDKATNAREGNG